MMNADYFWACLDVNCVVGRVWEVLSNYVPTLLFGKSQVVLFVLEFGLPVSCSCVVDSECSRERCGQTPNKYVVEELDEFV